MSVTNLLRAGAFLALLTLGRPSYSATIFNNFVEPGDQYGPDSVGVGAIPVPGVFAFTATNFTPAFNSRLTGLELPLAVVSGAGEISVQLLADSGDLPGSLIEAFHLTGFSAPGPLSLIPIASTLHPILDSKTQYWVAVTGGTPTTFAVWALTLFAGDSSAGGASRSIVNNLDGGWTRNHGTRVGAMRINGDPIPEPGSVALVGSGLLSLLFLRKRNPRGHAIQSEP